MSSPAPRTTYWLTRFVVLRLLGVVYLVAFLSLARQAVPLLGEHGLLPVSTYLDRLVAHFGSRRDAIVAVPSFFWLALSDRLLVAGACLGATLALLVVAGFANALIMLMLWALYLSYVHVGQLWYGYGWEIQLLETGVLATFLCPLLDVRPFPRRPPPTAVVWLLRWLTFRIMIGAGLIKLRGDPCWRDLTCLYWHYETQPIPNPLSRILHFMPHWFQQLGVLYNHLAELVAPWFVFGPRPARHAAGIVLVVFQVILILSGNLSFLNWLTIVPILACFDDGLLGRVLPAGLGRRAAQAEATAKASGAQTIAVGALVAVVAVLSIRPVQNLFSSRQAMNTSFDPLDLVNTYGAFGSVGRERDEIVFEGTADAAVSERTRWREYEFKCKPGDPLRRPCVASPWQWRLDWQIWFAAMTTPEGAPWTVHFVAKLLANDPDTLSLLARNPFPDAPPRYIRALLYRYTFAPPGNPEGAWWHRQLLGSWLPPLAVDDSRLRRFLELYGWGTGASVGSNDPGRRVTDPRPPHGRAPVGESPSA
jgi:hypothetical protein